MTFFWQNRVLLTPAKKRRMQERRRRMDREARDTITQMGLEVGKLKTGDVIEIADFLGELTPQERETIARGSDRALGSMFPVFRRVELQGYGGTINRMDRLSALRVMSELTREDRWKQLSSDRWHS